MKNKTLKTIKKHNLIEKNMHIVVGLSGGPDSVCLFDVLRELSEDFELKLHAVHVNHKFRPGAAEEDQRYVEELCDKSGIDCHVFEIDCNRLAVEEGLTSEEAGRKARYESFSKVATEIHRSGIPKEKIAIALAHNANDQCETILFRLMRGTGTDGLAGIPYKRFDENGFTIIRPIMDAKREEIEKYCEDRKLSPRIDHTNSENLYARNKIRNLLIPFIEENFNESLIDTVNRLGKIASQDREYMNNEAQLAYDYAKLKDHRQEVEAFDMKVLLNLHSAIRFRVYTLSLERLGMEQNITYAQGENIDKVLMSDSPSAMCDLTDGYIAVREYDRLTFRQTSTKNDESQTIAINTSEISDYCIRSMTMEEFEKFKASSANKMYAAFQGINPKELCIRTRKAGDKIKTSSGTKKIQDFFVDQKVPKLARDKVDFLTVGSEVLWILPSEEFLAENMRKKGRFSAKYKPSADSEEEVIVLEKL